MSKNKKKIIILIIVILVLCVGGYLAYTMLNKPTTPTITLKKLSTRELQILANDFWQEGYAKDYRTIEELEQYVLNGLKSSYINISDHDIEITTKGVIVTLKSTVRIPYYTEKYSQVDNEENKKTYIFYGNGSVEYYYNNQFVYELPVGTAIYSNGIITLQGADLIVSANRREIDFTSKQDVGGIFTLETVPACNIDWHSNEDGFIHGAVASCGVHRYTCECENMKIPKGALYYSKTGMTYQGGEALPCSFVPQQGDMLRYAGYKYIYNAKAQPATKDEPAYPIGWSATLEDKTKTAYDALITSMCNKPLTSINRCFEDCINLTYNGIPELPDTITHMAYAFKGCTLIEMLPKMPINTKDMTAAFKGCIKLFEPPRFTNLTELENLNNTFEGCTELAKLPVIPETVKYLNGTFAGCSKLEGTITLKCTFEEAKDINKDSTLKIELIHPDRCPCKLKEEQEKQEELEKLKSKPSSYAEKLTFTKDTQLIAGFYVGDTAKTYNYKVINSYFTEKQRKNFETLTVNGTIKLLIVPRYDEPITISRLVKNKKGEVEAKVLKTFKVPFYLVGPTTDLEIKTVKDGVEYKVAVPDIENIQNVNIEDYVLIVTK